MSCRASRAGTVAPAAEPTPVEKSCESGAGGSLAIGTKSGRSETSAHPAASCVGEPSAAQMRTSWSAVLVPANGARRKCSSAKTQPRLHTSTGGPYRRAPSRSSGHWYQRVTMSGVISPPSPAVSRARAVPKSASLSAPLGATSTLAGLRSRCKTPLAWRNATADVSIAMYAFTSGARSEMSARRITPSRSPTHHSKTRLKQPAASRPITPSSSTMFGWRSSFRWRTSRNAVK
mmetsp:Transcript_11391/g.36031  ORF Transcript_11391/g.36031 Transcript_11391/m.36031 type:complete len:233 (+) Transcript_11391:1017-1715(+)